MHCFQKLKNELKTHDGKEALNKNNLICKAIQISKKVNPDLGVITDVALDPFTDHGHDGIINNDQIDNDLNTRYSMQTSSRAGRSWM